jgi:hypothetical protein
VQPLITLVSLIAGLVIQMTHLPITTVGNAHNATQRMVGWVEDLTTQVRRIVSLAILGMLQPTITQVNAQIVIVLAWGGQTQHLIMQVSLIVGLVMQGMHLPTTTTGNVHNVTRQMGGQVQSLTTLVKRIVSLAI